MKIKKMVNVFIPVSVCNFECRYCYIPQVEGRKKNKMPEFRLDAKGIRRALSVERLGGPCFMNICGDGETLLPKEVPQIIIELLEEGHVIEVVTNGTLTNRFEEILSAQSELFSRLSFKFSYHYEQLNKKNMGDIFWKNVDAAKRAGCSFTIELTPHDELIPQIEDIKKDCIEHVGAPCHVTVAYNYKKNFDILTSLSKEEYKKVWGAFDSPMFDFKMSLLGQKRREFCMAGKWLMSVDIASGDAHQCYFGIHQNIYDNIERPLQWIAVGKHCFYPLCFNGHAMMSFGMIPEVGRQMTYEKIRNRKCADGTEWLSSTVKEAFSTKLYEENKPLTKAEKITNEIIIGKYALRSVFRKIGRKMKRS